MVFDEAIGTAFSMDPLLLLEAPVFLALMAGTGATPPAPLSVLEAIRRYSGKITAYVQRGRIHVPAVTKPNPLFGLLEKMTVEVKAPGGGVFHPKAWAIRFYSPDRSDVVLRLVILSRNMTADRSWDLSLQLEGKPGGRKIKENKPLFQFFKMLPELAANQVPRGRIDQANRFAEEIQKTQWELPDGFDEIEFFLPGVKGLEWKPEKSDRLAVISPFCSTGALKELQKSTEVAIALISRPDTLQSIPKAVLQGFGSCLHLDEAAETEDGEQEDLQGEANTVGLHAKAYVYETRYHTDYTHIVMGSANATHAALLGAKNIEILVKMVGKKNRVGGIDELIGADGLGEFLVPFEPQEEVEIDTGREAAEASLEKARELLVESKLKVRCTPSDQGRQWGLGLVGRIPQLEGITKLRAWPITLQPDHAIDLMGITSNEVILGDFSASSVTGLIAFELFTGHPEVNARFVLNLPVDGLPAERDAEILQTVINNQDGFIRYLLLLLGGDWENGDYEGGGGAGFGTWLSRLAQGEDIPLLEELTKAYSRSPSRLKEIAHLIEDLTSQESHKSVVPERFLELWSVYEQAMKGHA